MERKPRNYKRDHLVNAKIIMWAYGLTGVVQGMGGMLVYFMILNDYGIKPYTLFWMTAEEGYLPLDTDVYNPALANYGNSNAGNDEFKTKLDWFATTTNKIDIRLFYTNRPPSDWSQCRWREGSETPGLKFYRISPQTETEICYTTDSLHYAQSGYLAAIVIMQWATLIATKTRNLSLG